MIPTKKLKKLLALSALSALAAGAANAGDWGKAVIDDKMPIAAPWSICDIFDYSTLYEGDGFIREIKFKGRYHGQHESTTIDFDDPAIPDDGRQYWRHRRWRAGFGVEFANGWEFTNTYNLDTSDHFDGDRFVNSIEEFVFEKEFGDVEVAIGKQKPDITREYATSSKKIRTFERSSITNEVTPDKLWGASVVFPAGPLTHKVGVYGVAYDDDFAWPEFDDAGVAIQYSTSYAVCESTTLFFDYLYSDSFTGQDPAFAATGESYEASNYEHVFSIGTETEMGRFELFTDIIFGFNKANSLGSESSLGAPLRAANTQPVGQDTFGFVVMPTYDITDKLEFVFRWAYASDCDLQDPADEIGSAVDSYNIDAYHTLYWGLNYRICGDKLKLMAGYEQGFGELAGAESLGLNPDFDTNAWLFGVRTYW